MFKRCYKASVLSGFNPKGRQSFFRISALHVAYLASLNHEPRALIPCANCWRRLRE